MFITVSRFPLKRFQEDEDIRLKAERIENHLRELALDVGLDPDLNVRHDESEDEFRVGVSEEMDMYLREAPGEWRNY